MIIPTRHISDEQTMPCLGLGTWQLTGTACTRAVSEALKLGYRHIDTAEMYGNNRSIGEALRHSGIPRKELFVTTKVSPRNLRPDDVLSSVAQSLDELRLDYVDLLLVHWPNKRIAIEDTLSAFKQLYDDGRIRAIGVSNFTVAHLKEVFEKTDIPIVCNQVEFHPLLYQKELKSFCDHHGITLVAYSPLGHGHLIGNEVLERIGEKHAVSAAQASLAWLFAKGLCAIPKASSKKHLSENLRSLEISLDEEDVEAIDALDENKRFINPGFAEFDREDVGT